MSASPKPLVPADCDLSGLKSMMLDVDRLRRSRLALVSKRRPELGWISVLLWGAAWCETPAASIEDDDDVLADRAMVSHERWLDLKPDILKAWILCSNGRWYHPVVSEKANALWAARLRKRHEMENARTRKRWKADKRDGEPPVIEFGAWLSKMYPVTFAMKEAVLAAEASVSEQKADGKPSVTETPPPAAAPDPEAVLAAEASVSEQNQPDSALKGKVKVKQKDNTSSVPKGTGASAPPDGGLSSGKPDWWPQQDRYGRITTDITDKIMFDVGKVILGASAGGQITKLRKSYRGDQDALRKVTDLLLQAEQKSDPSEWFAAVVKNALLDEPTFAKHEIFPEHSYPER